MKNRLWSVILVALVAWGCDASGPGGKGDLWGAAVHVPVLDPFQGKWKLDHERTMTAWEKEGVAAEQIEQAREREKNGPAKPTPELEMALRATGKDPAKFMESVHKLHRDITIEGHIASGDGFLGGEYRFFGLHEHDGKVCGKAWHHEDPNDPGDMSKCYVQLSREGEELHFRVRMQEVPSLSDPDLAGSPSLVLDSAAKCDAESPSGSDWSEWTTYVFVRKTGKE